MFVEDAASPPEGKIGSDPKTLCRLLRVFPEQTFQAGAAIPPVPKFELLALPNPEEMLPKDAVPPRDEPPNILPPDGTTCCDNEPNKGAPAGAPATPEGKLAGGRWPNAPLPS